MSIVIFSVEKLVSTAGIGYESNRDHLAGFQFLVTITNIKEGRVSGNRVYLGTLQKGEDQLRTAWWFSNRQHNIISQLDWRWRVFLGKPYFRHINVTAADEKDLNVAIREWL